MVHFSYMTVFDILTPYNLLINVHVLLQNFDHYATDMRFFLQCGMIRFKFQCFSSILLELIVILL